MIVTLKNDDGFIYAYIEWYPTNGTNKIENYGEYLWIQHCWIHEKYRGNGCLNKLIEKIKNHKLASKANKVYWYRQKEDKKLKIFNRRDIWQR